MAIVVTSTGSSTPVITATTTGCQVAAKVSQDIRGLLGVTGGDLTILLDYINRVHEDLLRRTRWKFLHSGINTFTTTSGVSKYYLGAGSTPAGYTDTGLDLDDIFTLDENSVYDRTNYRDLVRIGARPLTDNTQVGYPDRYFVDGEVEPDTIELYMTPNGAYSIEFRYFKVRNQITDCGDILLVPDNYIDVVVDGVASRAFELLKMYDEANQKQARYVAGVMAMQNDKNLFPKSANFMRPDGASLVTSD